ncbi:MAG: hypothetical protein ACFFCW_40430 [Candidatus Hodarchaeota archaeon]
MGKVKKIFFPIICLAVALFIFAFLWKVPEWQIASKIASSKEPVSTENRIELENSTRRTWAQILGGVFFLITAYFTWRRVTATERNVLIAQEGQITERFTKAIEQLGDKEHLEVRLGGIYALKRIARDSKKDHWTIMEILTAYVRANAPWRGNADEAEEKRKGEEVKSKDSIQFRSPATDKITLPADIQAIITILATRTLAHEIGEDRRLDLCQTNLRGVNIIRGGFLGKSDLVGANLQGANHTAGSINSTNRTAV